VKKKKILILILPKEEYWFAIAPHKYMAKLEHI
jgi:hypothetical protein